MWPSVAETRDTHSVVRNTVRLSYHCQKNRTRYTEHYYWGLYLSLAKPLPSPQPCVHLRPLGLRHRCFHLYYRWLSYRWLQSLLLEPLAPSLLLEPLAPSLRLVLPIPRCPLLMHHRREQAQLFQEKMSGYSETKVGGKSARLVVYHAATNPKATPSLGGVGSCACATLRAFGRSRTKSVEGKEGMLMFQNNLA